VLAYHPHEPRRRARALAASLPPREIAAVLADLYAVDAAQAEAIAQSAGD
jgi:hypothetical protein